MLKINLPGRLLLSVMLVLSVCALTACVPKPPVILSDSVTMRIQPGDLQKSPAFKGWALSDAAVAKLLEKAEACQVQK